MIETLGRLKPMIETLRRLNRPMPCDFCLAGRTTVHHQGKAICISCIERVGGVMPRDRKEPDSEMVDQDQLVTHAKLHVFTTHGKSFTFNSVCDVESNESQLSFTYKAKSDGMWKIAYFFMANVAGFSVLEA